MTRYAILTVSAAIVLTSCDAAPAGNQVSTATSTAAAATPAAASPTETITPRGDDNFAVRRDGDVRRTGTDTNYTLELPTDVLFDFDTAELRAAAAPMLDRVLADLAGKRVLALQVYGHTDAKGDDAYNMRLSLRRAQAVCDYLKRAGKQYTLCLGRGEQEPVAPNTRPDGSDDSLARQRNRRVEIKVALAPDAKAMLDNARRQAREAARP